MMPRVRPLRPAALPYSFLFHLPARSSVGGGVGDAAVGGDEESDGELCDGFGVLAGAVGDVDAALGGLGEVDGVDARAGADDEGEGLAGGDGVGGDLGGADDEDFGVADGGGEVFGLEVGVGDDVVAEGVEGGEGGLGEFVGDEDFHGLVVW